MSPKTVPHHDLPAASLGNARTLTVIRYGDKSGSGKAYIQAGLHADEAEDVVHAAGDHRPLVGCIEIARVKGFVAVQVIECR